MTHWMDELYDEGIGSNPSSRQTGNPGKESGRTKSRTMPGSKFGGVYKEAFSPGAYSYPAYQGAFDGGFSPKGALEAPAGGRYYQAGAVPEQAAPEEQRMTLSKIYSDTFAGIKMSAYRIITEFPIIFRDFAFRRLNKAGKIFDLLSSIYQMGADSGPVQAMRTDFLHDRLELIVNDKDQLLAMRMYNDRKETPFIKTLRSGQPISLHGRPVEKDDMNYTPGGLVAYKTEKCGGDAIRLSELQFDDSYRNSGTLKWATHKEIDKVGSTRELERNLIEFSLSYYIHNTGKAKRDYIQEHPETKDHIYRITLPRGYSPTEWDVGLCAETVLHSLIGKLFLHLPFKAAESLYKRFKLEAYIPTLKERELSLLYVPEKRVITKV